MGAQIQWEYQGVAYYSEELKFMPMHYRFIQECALGCTFYISGLDQRMKEFQAVEVVATCMGRWPPRNCGVLALQILRKASWESPEGPRISGGAFIPLANKELANAFMHYMSGITHRGRTLAVQPAQEFALRPRTKNVNLLGVQRFLRDVWNCPVESL